MGHACFPLFSHVASHYSCKFSPLFHPISAMRELRLREWDDVAKVTQSLYTAAVRVQMTRLPVFLSLTRRNLSLLGSSRLSIVPRELTRGSVLGLPQAHPNGCQWAFVWPGLAQPLSTPYDFLKTPGL